jgi:hypothetical protein
VLKGGNKAYRPGVRRPGCVTSYMPSGRVQLCRWTALTLACASVVLAQAPAASAAVSCPNANPVVDENNCKGAGSSAWRLTNLDPAIAGFATKTSFPKGESVPLKIGRALQIPGSTRVNIQVFRTGYYGDMGARLVYTASSVVVNNNQQCNAPDVQTGRLDCGNWAVTATIPATALPASGVYVAKLTATDADFQNHVIFVVRDDNRVPEAKMLLVVPTASYEAYNTWGGKSLYFDKNGGPATVAGTGRAVKVSFNRPLDNPDSQRDRYFGPDHELVSWLEKQGYDVAYSDDVAVHANGAELREHKAIVVPGHSEYWSREEFNAFKAARDAGTNLASFSANTSYWKVRYEDGDRTLVCYKTVQGDGSGGSGAVSANDWGPDGLQNTADDALGLDGLARTADDRPENSTTTFRDDGAPPGDPSAPPGGRVGPDMPENGLWGVMYVGDNDSKNYPLVVPAANASAEFAGDRTWRNAGLSTNSTTSIGTEIVGWEWDAVPTQAQYLSRQPAGVKRLSESPIPDDPADPASWLLDEGRQRSDSPPNGQPNTVNAVRYTAASGALVFASGTMQWAFGLTSQPDARIAQATYNVLSDMNVQPDTPSGVTLDPANANKAPIASFTATPNPVQRGNTVQFDASSSSDPDGLNISFEWDLDGNGTFETNTGPTPTTLKLYPDEASIDVRLRVTDVGGASDVTVRTLTVIGNQPPTASLKVSPNPAVVGRTVSFDASASSDPDGTIAKVEWDLDGNGAYELDTGTAKTTARTYSEPATINAGVRLTDNEGKTAVSSVSVTITPGGVSSYPDAVLDTAGLLHFWRMGEASGTTLADAKSGLTATATSVAFGVPGGPLGDPNTAVQFDGGTSFGRADVSLSHTPVITLEFWLKWDRYLDDDALAFELTPNFNQNAGGLIVDPNAPQAGGTFGVALGQGLSRNNAFFPRPSAGGWHHYAIVLDTSAPAAGQITPYVDGKPVTYTKLDSGTGAGPFANAPLYFMSRAGAALFGKGALDEVAIYDRALDAATVAEHFASYGTNRRPVARFSLSPDPARENVSVTFDGAASSDPDGTIARYEWDLDGNGSYETDSGSSPQVTRSYATPGDVAVRLRVTDDETGTDTQLHTARIGNQKPAASFKMSPNPSVVDLPVTFDASASDDIDGTIAKYEWDLDGDGTFEIDGGTSSTATKTYGAPATRTVTLRVTDDSGVAATSSAPLTTNSGGVSNYGDAILDTPGLVSYWRMGETGGPTFADSKGTSHATATSATFGVPGGVAGDPNTAAAFDGTTSTARAAVDLSSTRQLTVEFWLKWKGYTGDDHLAMEFTDNFNGSDGGFVVDPDAPQFGGKFGVGLGRFESRNNVFFDRPSAGQWHHYAFVMDTTASAASQITPYVDGRAVPYSKLDSGTGAGSFANANLWFMSRGGASLFGAGDLDEVAVYNRALPASAIAEHFSSSGTNRRPVARLALSASAVKAGQSVTLTADTSSDSDGSIVKYQWDLDGNGSYETDTGTTSSITRSFASAGSIDLGVRVLDDQFATDTDTQVLTVGNGAPTASFTATPSSPSTGEVVQFDASASEDPDGSIVRYEWDIDGDNTYETDTGASATTSTTYATAGARSVGLRVTDEDGASATATQSVNVKTGTYADTVLGTTGLVSYWRMEETSGTTFADGKGTSPATVSGATLGVPGALAGATNLAARFDGIDDFARANLDLSTTSAVTVEFWLRWNSYLDDDDLAMEFTDNFNANPGGFLIDPSASDGTFAVGLGFDETRNTAQFARPSAGAWHHIAIVFDTTAVAAEQVTPYVDGKPVPYSKARSGTGAGAFANAALSFMSRNGAALFGGGDLDELAVYNRALSAATVAEHYASGTP